MTIPTAAHDPEFSPPRPRRIRPTRRLTAGLALILAIGLGAAGAWLYLHAPPRYVATATLHVSTRPKRILFGPRDNEPDFATIQRTQVALLRSRRVLAHALAKLASERGKLKTLGELEDPEGWLEDQLRVEFIGGSELLNISLGGDRPEDLQKIVNQVVDSYVELVVDAERVERNNRLEQLKKLWEKYQAELRDKRKMLKEVVAVVGGHDAASPDRREELAAIRRELARLKVEQIKGDARRAAGKARGDAGAEAPDREAAILAAQVEALAREAASLAAEPRTQQHVVVDLKDQEAAMAIAEEAAQAVGREVERITVELEAPERIQVHSKARVPVARPGLFGGWGGQGLGENSGFRAAR